MRKVIVLNAILAFIFIKWQIVKTYQQTVLLLILLEYVKNAIWHLSSILMDQVHAFCSQLAVQQQQAIIHAKIAFQGGPLTTL